MKRKNEVVNILMLILIFFAIVVIRIGTTNINGSKIDFINQHVVFPDYFRMLFYNTKNIFPSFAFNIGAGENIYNFSYYGLLSPMVFISYLFPFIRMIDFVQIYMILVVVLSIIFMYSWLRKHFNEKISFLSTLLFLLSGPIIFHTHRHIMFINYMPFLILSFIGMDHYLDKNKRVLLIISIFLMIMSSYYYSVGGIISIIIYGIYKLIKENKINFKNIIKIVYPICISILMSMVLILPTLNAVFSGRDISSNVDTIDLFIPNLSNILYNAYSLGTTSILIIAIIYELYNKKNKFLSIILLILIFFPVIIYILNGFMYVRGKVLIPFIPIAILIISNFFNDFNYKIVKKRELLMIIMFALSIIFYILNKDYIFIIELVITIIIYFFSIKLNNKKVLIYFVVVSSLTCCFINNYLDELVNKKILSKNIKKYEIHDQNIYRVGALNKDDLNKVFDMNYYLSSIYSSLENSYYYNFSVNKIGNEMSYNISSAITSSNNILFNTLMGTKYYVYNDDLHVNENVLPIGFSTSKVLDKSVYEKLNYPENAYSLTTNIIVPKGNNTYKTKTEIIDLTYKSKYKNLNIEKKEDKYFIQSNNGTLDLKLDKVLKDKLLFISFDMEYMEDCSIGDTSVTINGVTNTLSCNTWNYPNNNTNFKYTIFKNTLENLTINFSKGKYIISNIRTYIANYDDIINYVNSVDEFLFDKELTTGDRIVGNINVKEDGYFIITIPYEEKGFTIFLDEKEIKYEKVNEAFIGFEIESGNHNIKIVYKSPLLEESKILSLIGFILMFHVIYIDKKRVLFT